MLLKFKSDLTVNGKSYAAGDTLEFTAAEARLLLQKHGRQIEAVYKDKAKHAPQTDKFTRKVQTTQIK